MKLTNPARNVGNLYHLLTIHNLSTLLVEKGCRSYVEEVLANVDALVDQRTSPVIDVQYVRAQDLEDEDDVADLLYPEPEAKHEKSASDILKFRYDLLVVRQHLVTDFLPLMHRTRYILIMAGRLPAQQLSSHTLVPFVKMNDTLDGSFYVNDLHSIAFKDTASIGMYQRTYIRDLPQRFMAKTIQLAEQLLTQRTEQLRVVELGSCSIAMRHHIDEVSTTCCTDSAHSTFFLCTLSNARVLSVDVSADPTLLLGDAMDASLFRMNSTLVAYKEGGIAFLQRYADKYKRRGESYRIGLLVLDAYGSRDAAEKNLEAYEAARMVLSRSCMILIADTDEKYGGKGSKLLPRAVRDGFIIFFQGRMTLLYRGSRVNLYTKEAQKSLTSQ